MTELERQLSAAFEALSTGLEQRLTKRDKLILSLSQQVSSLSKQLQQQSDSNVKLRSDLQKAFLTLDAKLTELAEG
ncbi:MAG: hypothetical protein PHU46_06545 [Rhodocyclaceae bacterium]|nr:hypothetical protein [Rhodocyclaceae bacterium]